MEYTLVCGKEMLSFPLEKERVMGCLVPKPLPSPPDERELVRKAVKAPIGSLPLKDLVNPGERVCIVVGDISRVWVRYHILVAVLLQELKEAGIRDGDITIVSATGSHEPQSREDLVKLVGKDAARRVKVISHDYRQEDLFRDYGTTRRGTPVRVNKHVADADRIVLTGGIVHHYLAGYGGGKKALLPGVAARQGIMANHRLSLNPEGPGLNLKVAAGRLKGNPLSEDMVEAARKVGPNFIVNVIINHEHRIARAVAGDLVAAHEAGCALVDQYFGVPIREKADLVVASCGGYPKDINLYQAYKTIHNCIHALKKGGVAILLMECPEGIGSPLYETICADFSCNGEREKELRRNFEIAGFCGYTHTLWAQENHFIAITGLPDRQVRRLHMTPAKTPVDALEIAGKWLRKDFKAYIMPEGSSTFPMFQE